MHGGKVLDSVEEEVLTNFLAWVLYISTKYWLHSLRDS